MPLTMVNALEMSNSPLIKKVISIMAQQNHFLSLLPFEVFSSTSIASAVYDGTNAPASTWAKLTADPAQTSGKFETIRSQTYYIRNQVRVDRAYMTDTNMIGDPTGNQIMMYLKEMSLNYNNTFVNNDVVTGNSDAFDGLRGRMNKRTDYGISSDFRVNMGALDLRSSAITAANINTFLRSLDDLLAAVSPTGTYEGVYIVCNFDVINMISQGLRLLGAGSGFTLTKDAFDRHVATYNGATFINAGLKYPYTSLNRIMTNTETSTGLTTTGGTATSLFVFRIGEDALVPWIDRSLDQAVVPLGYAVDGILNRVTFDFGFGLISQSRLCIGQMYNFLVK